ncbi:MAG: hypothetical protein QM726_19930 [Chitinophagaceae bacterium]
MLSKNELVEKYKSFTDEELFSYYKQLDTLSTDGQTALNEVIESKGGIERLKNYIANKTIIDKEKARIIAETKELAKVDPNIEFIKKTTSSSILDLETTNSIIEKAFADAVAEKRDTQINPKTISGSIIGGLLSSIIGGIIWGVWLIQTHRIWYIFIPGLGFLSYLIINRMTRQSKNNSAVLIATIISTALALGLGQLIFELFA